MCVLQYQEKSQSKGMSMGVIPTSHVFNRPLWVVLLCIPGHLFNGMLVYLLPAGIGNTRCDIFKRQITQNGGQVKSALCTGVTHVIVDDSMDSERALRLLKLDSLPLTIQLVGSSWLSQCITGNKLISTADYSLLLSDRYS